MRIVRALVAAGVMSGAAAPAQAYWVGGYYAPPAYYAPYYRPPVVYLAPPAYPAPVYAAPAYAAPRPFVATPAYAAPRLSASRPPRLVRRARGTVARSPFEAAGMIAVSVPGSAGVLPRAPVAPAAVAPIPAPAPAPAVEAPPTKNVYPPERAFTPFTGD